ncbi:MAG: YlxM family DNA-binding protein [Acutalibacteraceae bacterium]
MEKNLKISLLLDFYGELLSPKQREITENYYNNDFSLSEIAANTGITRQGVRDSVKRTEAALIEMEEKLGLYKRFEQMQKTLDCILKRTEEIIIENKNINNVKINENAGQIISLVKELKE